MFPHTSHMLWVILVKFCPGVGAGSVVRERAGVEAALLGSREKNEMGIRMKKTEAEPAIRQLIGNWLSERGAEQTQKASGPRFSDFEAWLNLNGYGHYLDFRSTMGSHYDAELWFDEETGQLWKR